MNNFQAYKESLEIIVFLSQTKRANKNLLIL